MIRSMTGFGAGHGASRGEELDVEVRSVNHKFCEVKVRAPRELGALELDASKAVKERLARGGVEVSLRRAGSAGGQTQNPAVQASFTWVHAVQPPQWAGSVRKFVHTLSAPPQKSGFAAGQPQAPPKQVAPGAQRTSQSPQFSTLQRLFLFE